MPAGEEHDDMMYDIDSLQLGLSRPMVSVSYLDQAAGLCSGWDPRKPCDIVAHCRGNWWDEPHRWVMDKILLYRHGIVCHSRIRNPARWT